MPGHLIDAMKTKAAALPPRIDLQPQGSCCGRERVSLAPSQLPALSRRGPWGIRLFLVLSAATLYLSEAGLPAMVPDLRELFGDPPPPVLVHLVLAVSWLSALVLIMGRVTGDAAPGYSWYNIGLPTVCYPLYLFADTASTHFAVVFCAGLILLLAEHWSVAYQVSKALQAARERSGTLPN
jgi:hypothetical protein